MVVFLKDEKAITITSAFLKNVNESNYKPNKKWVTKGSKLYKRPKNHGCKIIYSTDNEGRSVISEFLRILKNFSMKKYLYW